MTIKFFGKPDTNEKGSVASAMPAWYFDVYMENLEEEIKQKERAIKSGAIPEGELQYARETLKKQEIRLAEIRMSKPNLQGKDKDKVAASYKDIEQQLRDSFPSRSDELRGFVDAREELKKMKNPCIKMDKDVAKACNVKTNRDGMVSRDTAVRCYRMMGKALGDNTNTERLRRDGKFGTYHSENEITKAILEGFEQMKGA